MQKQLYAPKTLRRALALSFGLALVGLAGTAGASSMSYGDLDDTANGGVVMYLGVTESSATDPVPLFGAPAVNVNQLDFLPMGFGAFASNGGADLTDGQLNFTMMTTEGSGLTSLFLRESGDYLLSGLGDEHGDAKVSAALSVHIKILEVDGLALPDPIFLHDSTFFERTLSGDGEAMLAFWPNELTVDLAGILAENQVGYELGVTKAQIVIDDLLLAMAGDATTAAIFKKEFFLRPDGNFRPAPEPATLGLLGLALAFGLGARRRRTAAKH